MRLATIEQVAACTPGKWLLKWLCVFMCAGVSASDVSAVCYIWGGVYLYVQVSTSAVFS